MVCPFKIVVVGVIAVVVAKALYDAVCDNCAKRSSGDGKDKIAKPAPGSSTRPAPKPAAK